MKILEPNVGETHVLIAEQHTYICATDTKQKLFLKEIKVGPGQHTWEWISLRTDRFVDISGIEDRYCSFDNAINRAVNDLYRTVYEFESPEEMIAHWDDIKYVDKITTVYTSENKKE
jgi:hypothetical protein